MTDSTSDSAAAPDRKSMQVMARALARQPETARLLLGILVDTATDRGLAQALRLTVQSFVQAPSPDGPTNHVVRLVEAERPQFFDPDRPGE